jgi:hypothetical protein
VQGPRGMTTLPLSVVHVVSTRAWLAPISTLPGRDSDHILTHRRTAVVDTVIW